jgi:Zn finger protein HypA/HybF involved in hydrogenase expression
MDGAMIDTRVEMKEIKWEATCCVCGYTAKGVISLKPSETFAMQCPMCGVMQDVYPIRGLQAVGVKYEMV